MTTFFGGIAAKSHIILVMYRYYVETAARAHRRAEVVEERVAVDALLLDADAVTAPW